MDYKTSGVDIDAGNEAVRRIRGLARSTFTAGVLSDIGSFGGLFQLEPGRYRLRIAARDLLGMDELYLIARGFAPGHSFPELRPAATDSRDQVSRHLLAFPIPYAAVATLKDAGVWSRSPPQ